jgi:hypothetical protein
VGGGSKPAVGAPVTKPAVAAAPAKPASPTKAAASATGISSYRAEAAELLAASAQRRRRRTVTNPVSIEPAAPEPVRRRRTPPGMPGDD